MDPEEFRKNGKLMVDYIVDYYKTMRERPVVGSVSPGYLRDLMPEEAPQSSEDFQNVFQDIERLIMPGVTQWQHPQFHAFFPTAFSFPSILADMLSSSIACIGFSWIASPACTELEVITLDWMAKALGLPNHFLFTSGLGGGVIQDSASSSSLIALLAARSKAIRHYHQVYDSKVMSRGNLLDKFVVYASDQSNSSIIRACQIAMVQLHTLSTLNEERSVKSDTLLRAVKEDKDKGFIPLLCYATLGTTSSCAFDDLEGIAEVCKNEKIWCHVDAAYAGSAFLCPEFRYLYKGIELVDSFNVNAHKWMAMVFDCSLLWFKNKDDIVESFNVNPLYLKDDNMEMPDYRHWQIPLGRRFRSLKIWFTLRSFGIEGLQNRIRKDVNLSKKFEVLIRENPKFEIVAKVIMGLVCFRLKGSNELNEALYKKIKEDKRIFLISSKFDDIDLFFLRFAICSAQTEKKDVIFAYNVINELAMDL